MRGWARSPCASKGKASSHVSSLKLDGNAVKESLDSIHVLYGSLAKFLLPHLLTLSRLTHAQAQTDADQEEDRHTNSDVHEYPSSRFASPRPDTCASSRARNTAVIVILDLRSRFQRSSNTGLSGEAPTPAPASSAPTHC